MAQLAYFAGDTSTATTRFKYNYFDLPIKLNYAINKNKLQIITSLGMTFNFHLGSRQYLKLSNPTIKFKSGNYSPNYVRKVINYSPTVGLGLGYSLTQNTKILFQPTFSYMMKSEWSDWNTYTANGSMQGRFETEHLWKFGISICLRHLVK